MAIWGEAGAHRGLPHDGSKEARRLRGPNAAASRLLFDALHSLPARPGKHSRKWGSQPDYVVATTHSKIPTKGVTPCGAVSRRRVEPDTRDEI